jgi:hypothetical protein
MSRFFCPSCEGPWVPAGALRRSLNEPTAIEEAPTARTCPRCEADFERALWSAFDPSLGRAAAYREAEQAMSARRSGPASGASG